MTVKPRNNGFEGLPRDVYCSQNLFLVMYEFKGVKLWGYGKIGYGETSHYLRVHYCKALL